MAKEYQRISCDLYDQLEAYAIQKKELTITYLNAAGKQEKFISKIIDLKTANKEEFLISADGKTIRLDQLVSMTPISPPIT